MNNANGTDKMNWVLPQSAAESIQRLIQLFLDKLTAAQRAKLESGSKDHEIDNAITEMCVEIINIIYTSIFEAFKNSVTEGKSKSPRLSPELNGSKSISGYQVQEGLGNSIQLALEEAVGVRQCIECQNSKEVTEIVAMVVASRVNSELSKSSEGSESSSEEKPSPVTNSKLSAMARHMVTILRKLTSISSSKKKQQEKKTLEKEDQSPKDYCELVNSSGRPVPSQEGNKPEKVSRGSTGSFTLDTTEAVKEVKEILEKEVSYIPSVKYNMNVSKEEYDQLVSSNSGNTEETASLIVQVISEELQLLESGTPGVSESGTVASCWRKVIYRLKAFFVKNFAMTEIIKLVAKLRSKFNRFPPTVVQSTEDLITGVESLVEEMIPPEEERESTGQECLYEKMAEDIYRGNHILLGTQLSNFVFHQLNLDKKRKLHFMLKIQTEVDSFMKLMWNWLVMQKQQRGPNNRVHVVAEQIEGVVVNLSANTSPLSAACEKSSTRGSIIKSIYGVEEMIPPEGSQEKRKSTGQVSLCETTSEDRSSVKDDAVTEQLSSNIWDERSCMIMAFGLVSQFLDNDKFEDQKPIILALRDKIFAAMGNTERSYKLNKGNIKKVAKAVDKRLCAMCSGMPITRFVLMSQDPLYYDIITDILEEYVPKTKTDKLITFLIGMMSGPAILTATGLTPLL